MRFSAPDQLLSGLEMSFSAAEKLISRPDTLFSRSKKLFSGAEKLFPLPDKLWSNPDKLWSAAEKSRVSPEKLASAPEKSVSRPAEVARLRTAVHHRAVRKESPAVVESQRLLLEKRAMLQRLRRRFAHIPEGVSLADELIAERRARGRPEE